MKVLKPIIALVVILGIAVAVIYYISPGYIPYLYGKAVYKIGDKGKALLAFESARNAEPDKVTFARAYASTLNDLGSDLEDPSYYSRAYDYTHDWIEEHDTELELWQMYVEEARAQFGLGNQSSAKIAIDRATELMPTDYEALVYKAVIYRDMAVSPNGQVNRNAMDRVIGMFEQAIEIRNFTQTWWAHYELALAFKYIGDETRALNQVNQCLSQFPPRWMKLKAERLKADIQSSGRSER